LSFKPTSEPIKIAGQINQNPKDSLGYIEGLTIFAKVGNQACDKAIVGKKGKFSLTVEKINGDRLDIFCYGIGVDTVLLFSTTNIRNLEPKMELYFPMKLKKNIFGKVICPICHKTDKVFPIIYGDGQIVQQKIKNGDTTYTNIVNKKYYAGTCINQVARYYCDRDKIKF